MLAECPQGRKKAVLLRLLCGRVPPRLPPAPPGLDVPLPSSRPPRSCQAGLTDLPPLPAPASREAAPKCKAVCAPPPRPEIIDSPACPRLSARSKLFSEHWGPADSHPRPLSAPCPCSTPCTRAHWPHLHPRGSSSATRPLSPTRWRKFVLGLSASAPLVCPGPTRATPSQSLARGSSHVQPSEATEPCVLNTRQALAPCIRTAALGPQEGTLAARDGPARAAPTSICS